ncbi:hypothetical protein [Streptosporangium canum]|uniref:hypothetical protein n=1 Tax=Streptosporangium canum TaxID=324952 RepID=UPI0033A6A7F9
MTLTKNRAAELRALYALWTIWQSDLGRWWAMRAGNLTMDQVAAGATATVDADDLDQLSEQLAFQEQIRAAT